MKNTLAAVSAFIVLGASTFAQAHDTKKSDSDYPTYKYRSKRDCIKKDDVPNYRCPGYKIGDGRRYDRDNH